MYESFLVWLLDSDPKRKNPIFLCFEMRQVEARFTMENVGMYQTIEAGIVEMWSPVLCMSVFH